MSENNVSLKLIIASIIMVFMGGVVAADTVGLINIKQTISNVPLIKKYIANDNDTSGIILNSPLIEENQKLKNQLADLNSRLLEMENESKKQSKDFQILMETQKALEQENQQLKENQVNAKSLAVYYSEMKAVDVARILNELDDNVVLEIFSMLESDHVAKILTSFDTIRSARLSKKIIN